MRAAMILLLAWSAGFPPAPAQAAETAALRGAATNRCWFDHGAIVVPAAFGDIAGDFLLDPATPNSQIDDTHAEMTGALTPTLKADLRFAGHRIRGVEMAAADLGARERPFAASLAGVIGADVLKAWVTEIQAEPCRVRLSRRAGRPWPIRMPLKVINGAFAVPAAISDGAASRAGWFAVATGQPGVVVANAKLTRDPPADADPDWPPARLRALSMGGLLFEHVPAGVTDQPGLAGSIGEEIWFRYRMRLDPRRGRLELAPTSRRSSRPR
jgi:hypothetical protein